MSQATPLPAPQDLSGWRTACLAALRALIRGPMASVGQREALGVAPDEARRRNLSPVVAARARPPRGPH
eukprot:1466585-Heterocapsa_arctica.AAC.1